MNTTKHGHFEIRAIRKDDNSDVANIIRNVMPEFGARGPGFAINDPEVACMYESYQSSKSRYFVLIHEDRVVGGGGIAQLQGADQNICEFRKMYFLPEVRGFGYGQKLLEHCLKIAQQMGYKQCYLETLENMHQAKSLYEKNGFRKLCASMGNTGHFGCDAWYIKDL